MNTKMFQPNPNDVHSGLRILQLALELLENNQRPGTIQPFQQQQPSTSLAMGSSIFKTENSVPMHTKGVCDHDDKSCILNFLTKYAEQVLVAPEEEVSEEEEDDEEEEEEFIDR